MWCVCIDKVSGELFVMGRAERETMIDVMKQIGQPVPSLVLRVKETKEEAEKHIQDILDTMKLIDKI